MHYFNIITVDYLPDSYHQVNSESGGSVGASSYWSDPDVETVVIPWSWDVVANRKLDKEEHSFDTHKKTLNNVFFSLFNPATGILTIPTTTKNTVRSLPCHETDISLQAGDTPQNVTGLKFKSIFSHERNSLEL